MKKYLFLVLLLAFSLRMQSQQTTVVTPNLDTRVITTAMPSLLIAADARAAGLADQGVATSPDNYSQQWNLSKYAFAEKERGLSLTYTPYLTELVNDIFLGGLTFYNKMGERGAVSASFRYFSMGEIEFRNNATDVGIIEKPNEFMVDLGYSLKLSDQFSMGVGMRYMRSDLRLQSVIQGASAKPASSFAVDLGGYYQSQEKAYSSFNGIWRGGFSIQNLGPKISYEENGNENFLPTTLRLGGGFDFILPDGANKISLNVEVSKLLVPTPPVRGTRTVFNDVNGDGQYNAVDDGAPISVEPDYIIEGKDDNVNFFKGFIQSFGDAPGGGSEELQELTYSVGAEYTYQDNFAFRAGYFNENEIKGARQFFSLGAGFRYSVVNIDVSYLISASKVPSPLENTLRFSLGFNF